jgi:hypothetical protein
MRSTLKITAISLGLLLVGCGSTSKNLSKVDGEFIYPSMPILEESVFVWNDEDSEALNIVKMAQPAGIGNSLRDYQDGTQASIGQIGGLSGLFDAGLGLMSSGLFTVAQGESLRGGVNSAVEFKPAIVEVVDQSLVYVQGKPSYKKVRDYVANKVMKSIEVDHPDIEWGGIYSIYNGSEKFDFRLVINNESVCKKVRQVSTGDINAEPFMKRNFSEIYVDGEDVIRNYCSVGFDLTLPYKTVEDKIVIVAEMVNSPYFVEYIVRNYEGYVVIPDYFAFNSKNIMRADFAFVAKKGEKLLFQNPR